MATNLSAGVSAAAMKRIPPHAKCAANPAAEESARAMYEHMAAQRGDEHALAFLQDLLHQVEGRDSDLPADPDALLGWMHANAANVGERYQAYLAARKAGGRRLYFSNRAHALYFLRNAAPTKLVDGAWLYGVLPQWRNPRLAGLVQTYVEELGEGDAAKNHVLLYRQLLTAHGLDFWHDLPEDRYLQGNIQLALGRHGDVLLPEVIGFNLGYEQLPLHLLITAYELNELGIDPYYFTLHVTVDNPDTGHAQRAVQSVLDNMPHFGDSATFYRRVANGYKLNDLGTGTCALIAGFDIAQEVIRIFSSKSREGRAAHSDYCRVAGRTINDWLSDPAQIPAFLQALQDQQWIKLGAAPADSKFWHLLQGPHAEMFGVFSPYELQVIHDWLRGDASADGAAVGTDQASTRPRSFRAQRRFDAAKGYADAGVSLLDDNDPELADLESAMQLAGSALEQEALLIKAMGPGLHWTAAGLYATQRFQKLRGVQHPAHPNA